MNITNNNITESSFKCSTSCLIQLILTSVIGTLGNIIVLIVYLQKRDKFLSTLFILVLAINDLIACTLVIQFTIYMEYVEYKVPYKALCYIHNFILSTMIPFCSMLLMIIAIDRFFCICFPFKRAITLNRAKLLIFSAFCFALIQGFLSGACANFYIRDNGQYECRFEHDNGTFLSQLQYYTQNIQTTTFCVCILSDFIFYSLIYCTVSRQAKKKFKLKGTASTAEKLQQMRKAGSPLETNIDDPENNLINSVKHYKSPRDKQRIQNLKTAAMLCVVTIVHFLTFFPSMLQVKQIIAMQLNIFYLYFINNAVNLIIYGFMSSSFRQELKGLFNNCNKKR